jgi:lipid-binding SYLF domain-containing protein
MRNLVLASALLVGTAAACGSTPDTPQEAANANQQANTALQMMINKDPSLPGLLESSAGYAVFPDIGKGGFIAGAAHGRGVLYEGGRPTGYVKLSQASLGAQIGAQTFTELIVFRSSYDVAKVKGNDYSLGGNVSAVVLTSGGAASTEFNNGVAVFVVPRGGAMAEVSLSGQKISFSKGG